MNRRAFIRSATGALLIPAFPSIVRAITPQQRAAILSQRPPVPVVSASLTQQYFGRNVTTGSASALTTGNRVSQNTANTTYTCPGSGSVLLESIEAYVKSNDTINNVSLRLAIYDTSNNLVAQGSAAVTFASDTPAWRGHSNHALISGDPKYLTGGTSYKFALTVNPGAVNIYVYYTAGTSGDYKTDSTDYTGGFPSTIAPATNNLALIGIRASVWA